MLRRINRRILIVVAVIILVIILLLFPSPPSSIRTEDDIIKEVLTEQRVCSASALDALKAPRPLFVSNVLRLAKFDCQDKEQFVRHLDGCAVVIEVGSFDGKEMARIAPHCRKGYTFEATPSKEERIRERLAAFPQVSVHMQAVGDYNGQVDLFLPNGLDNPRSQQDSISDQRFWSGENMKKMSVPIVRLDSIVKEHVDFMKVDVQGHEFAVLRGAEGIIRNYGIDILHLEMCPRHMVAAGDEPTAMLEWLHEMGYFCMDCEAYYPPDKFSHRTFEEFPEAFGSYALHGKEHGAWTDLVCYQTYIKDIRQ